MGATVPLWDRNTTNASPLCHTLWFMSPSRELPNYQNPAGRQEPGLGANTRVGHRAHPNNRWAICCPIGVSNMGMTAYNPSLHSSIFLLYVFLFIQYNLFGNYFSRNSTIQRNSAGRPGFLLAVLRPPPPTYTLALSLCDEEPVYSMNPSGFSTA